LVKKAYVPDSGDIVWINFTPQAGHEQAGHRPALVLSPGTYNARSGLMVCCAMTSKAKGYPFEVAYAFRGQAGVVLADQVRNVDWRARGAKFESKAPADVLEQVKAKLMPLLGFDS
jgi:mRNA interferase MazF